MAFEVCIAKYPRNVSFGLLKQRLFTNSKINTQIMLKVKSNCNLILVKFNAYCQRNIFNTLEVSSVGNIFITARNEVNIFRSMSRILSTGGAYMTGGVCGGKGACVAGGHACWGACMACGCAWEGGVHGRYYEIRSMSGRYAS